MSAEPAAAMPTPTESVPAAEDQKIGASEASSQAQPAPVVEEKSPASADTPLSKLLSELPSIIEEADHKEIWGVELSDASHVPTSIVLEKFLRANTKDVAKAKAQLVEALKWRKKVDPAKLLTEAEFDPAKFGDLGYVTVYSKTESHEKEIVTWNIYGAVKDNKETFGNVEEYVKSPSLISSANFILDLSNGVLL
jgi:hypothetical protein